MEKYMVNDKDIPQNSEADRSNIPSGHHPEQFNELSELSLEARMNVADQIGIPVENVGDAVASGTASGVDNSTADSDEDIDEENSDDDRER